MADKQMSVAMPGKPVIIGADMAAGRDTSALALKSREGVKVVLTVGATVDMDRDFFERLDASRKDERECLAMALTMIASARGATVKRRDDPPNPGYSGASIRLEFELGGVGAMCSIDNLHGGEYAIISWFNAYTGQRDLVRYFSSRFTVAVGGGVGRPHHKATSCPRTWYSLAMYLDGGLQLAAQGEAFRPLPAELT